jgi:hypothetical protein
MAWAFLCRTWRSRRLRWRTCRRRAYPAVDRCWTVDTLGWEGAKGHISAFVVAARVLAALRPGEIVLMHVGSNPDDHSTFRRRRAPVRDQ